MGQGDWLAIALVLAVTAALCWLTYLLLSRTFLAIATAKTGEAKRAYKEEKTAARSVPQALLAKELGRFTSSPNYMLNCGLSTVMLPLLGVFLLIKSGDAAPMASQALGACAGHTGGAAVRGAVFGGVDERHDLLLRVAGGQVPVAGTVPAGAALAGAAGQAAGAGSDHRRAHAAGLGVRDADRPARLLAAVLLVVMPQMFVWLSAALA